MAVTEARSGDLVWDPPGPGSWNLDKVHMPRPATRIFQHVSGALTEGFRDSAARFGWPFDGMGLAFVNGLMFGQPRPLDPAEFGARADAAATAFETRLWRADADRWDRDVKPAALVLHKAIIDVDPRLLDDDALAAHLRRCFDHYWAMWVQHHVFNGAHMIPVGDFIAGVHEWTGRPKAVTAQLLKGATPVSRGEGPEVATVVTALQESPDARRLVDDADATGARERLEELRARIGGPVGAWLDVVGYRLIDGFDIACPYALERPAMLLAGLRAALRHAGGSDPEAEARLLQIRDAVPAEHRPDFDQRYEDARYCFHVRDERGIYSDATAAGLMRRAVLAVGERLAERGSLPRPSLAVDASVDELAALLAADATSAPSVEELEARAAHRDALTIKDAPDFVGDPPSGPPPIAAMPPAMGRMLTALGTNMGDDAAERAVTEGDAVIGGIGASPGIYRGTARVLNSPDEFHRLEEGDVLITIATGEAFNVAIAAVSALVTDQGGVMSHAGITAREYGIPAVLGTREATSRIPDGATVVIDGDRGTVTWE